MFAEQLLCLQTRAVFGQCAPTDDTAADSSDDLANYDPSLPIPILLICADSPTGGGNGDSDGDGRSGTDSGDGTVINDDSFQDGNEGDSGGDS